MLGSYAAFLAKYRRILANAASLLKPKHLFVCVVANLRDERTHVLHMNTQSCALALCLTFGGV